MKYKTPKMQLGNVVNYQGTKYKDGSIYFQGNTGIHTGKQAVILPEVSTTPLQSIQNIMNDFKQSPTFKVYEKDKPLSGTDPVGQFIVEGAVLGKPTQYLLDKGLTAAVGSTSGELLNKALSGAKSLYYNKAPWTFKPDLISNKMLASEDVLLLKKPLNVREALDFVLKGSKSAKEFVLSDVVKSSAKRNIDLYNRINKTNIGYNEYSLAPGLTSKFVDNFDSFTNTNSPTGNTSGIGGIFDYHNNQLIFKRSNVTEPTVFHENLHSFGYGNKVYNQMRNKYIVDPEKIKGLSEIAKKYYVTGEEPAVHYAQLGKIWGVKPGDVYPGRAIVEEMINSKGLSGAPFYSKLSTNRDYKRFWDAISGNYFSTIPIVGTASLYNSINKNK